MPGARCYSNSWVDGNDNLWLFGGSGYAASGNDGFLNDLWKYNTHTGAWTWVSGDSTVNSPGKYGSRGGSGVADKSITPSARGGSAGGFYNGNGGPELVLFGGGTFIGGESFRNDCWVYLINTNQWVWVSGDSTVNGASQLSASGSNSPSPVFSLGNKPAARWYPAGWVAGNVFCIYGGQTSASAGMLLDDYWQFDLTGSLGGGWACLHPQDNNTTNVFSIAEQYQLNKPGSKMGALGFYDPAGNHAYLFGGTSYQNDLWQSTGAYSPSGYGEWKWIKGDSTPGTAGSYGSLGVSSAGNLPPSRTGSAISRDADGKFVLFGGAGGAPGSGALNDVWGYSPTSNAWTWLGGDSAVGTAANYGALGIQSPTNQIGSRFRAITWITSMGEMYVFGGEKLGIGLVNDHWKYSAPLKLTAADSLALVDLYDSTGGPQWKNHTGWLTSAPLSTWYGVIVQGGRVTSLVLMNNRLNGSLPASLANLSALRGFNVMGNQLRGALPALGNIPAFASGQFNISNNNFNFDGIEQQVQAHPAGAYFPQSRLTIHRRGDTLSVGAGGTLFRNAYTWWNNGVLAANVLGDSTFVATASGNYSVNVTNSIATQLVLTSDLLPVAGDTSIAPGCAYETVRLTGSHCLPGRLSVDSSLKPMTILWFRNDTLVRRVTGGWQTGGTVVAGGNGAGAAANQLNTPTGIWLDARHNLYVADDSNRRVQRWAPGATSGATVMGGDALGYPFDLTGDAAGNLYVLANQQDSERVQQWAPGASSGTTMVHGWPEQYWGIARDRGGNIYLSDDSRAMVLKWAPGAAYGVVVAGGNGAGDGANQLGYPNGVAVDNQGNLYVADVSPSMAIGGRIVRWAPGAATGVVLAGGASAYYASNRLGWAGGIAVDGAHNVYIADPGSRRVQCWAPGATSGITVGDSSVIPAAARPFYPWGLQVDDGGNVYVADSYNHRVLRFSYTIDHSFSDSLPGTYKAVLINSSGCYYTSLPFVVGSPVPPAIRSSRGDSVCQGDSLTLLAGKAASYQWFNGADSLAGANGASLVVRSTGVYSVRGVDSLGCAAMSAPMMVSVVPLPERPVITRQDTVLLSSAAQGNQWFFNNVAIPGATNPSLSPSARGGYSVMVTANGCPGPMSEVFAYTPASVSSMVSLYPIPARDVLTIVNTAAHPVTVQVCDMYGKTLRTLTGLTGSYSLSISSYGSGMYVLYIVDPVTGRNEQKTFVKL